MQYERQQLPIAKILDQDGFPTFVSKYRMLTAIGRHFEMCYNELVRRRGVLGQVRLHTRMRISPKVAILVESLPDGTQLLVQAESNSA